MVVDRLAVAKFWKSRADTQWAAKLLVLHRGDIDLEYIKEAACEQQVEDILSEVWEQSRIYAALLDKDPI